MVEESPARLKAAGLRRTSVQVCALIYFGYQLFPPFPGHFPTPARLKAAGLRRTSVCRCVLCCYGCGSASVRVWALIADAVLPGPLVVCGLSVCGYSLLLSEREVHSRCCQKLARGNAAPTTKGYDHISPKRCLQRQDQPTLTLCLQVHSEGVDNAEPAEEYSVAAEAARQHKGDFVSRKGVHPYRIILSEVVRKLRNTKTRVQALLSGQKPDDSEDWCAFAALTCAFGFCVACSVHSEDWCASCNTGSGRSCRPQSSDPARRSSQGRCTSSTIPSGTAVPP